MLVKNIMIACLLPFLVACQAVHKNSQYDQTTPPASQGDQVAFAAADQSPPADTGCACDIQHFTITLRNFTDSNVLAQCYRKLDGSSAKSPEIHITENTRNQVQSILDGSKDVDAGVYSVSKAKALCAKAMSDKAWCPKWDELTSFCHELSHADQCVAHVASCQSECDAYSYPMPFVSMCFSKSDAIYQGENAFKVFACAKAGGMTNDKAMAACRAEGDNLGYLTTNHYTFLCQPRTLGGSLINCK